MSVWGELIGRGILAWLKHRPFSKESRTARKAKRAARKAKRDRQPDEAAGEFLTTEDEGISMKGYKTYTGIVVAGLGVVLGWLGVGESDAGTLAAQIGSVLEQVMTIGGLLFAAYGRAKATQ